MTLSGDPGPPPPPPDATTRDPIDELPPVLLLNGESLEFPPSPTVIVYGPGDNETGSEILIGAGTTAVASTVGAFVGGIVGSALVTTAITTALTTIGTSMIIGGVTDLISGQNSPQNVSSVSDVDPAIRGSYSFSGIQNVSTSGVPVPIIYGLVFSGSILISAGTDTAQIRKTL